MSANESNVLIVQERNAGHTPQVTYTRGLDLSGSIEGAGGIGGLLMRSHGYSSGNWSTHNAYHSDANGNVTALMNSSGVLQASYKYNPYGGMISSSGTLAGANTMRFSSKPAIFSATGSWGFYYYGYRFYDPGMQRWLNRDPIEETGGIGLYEHSLNDPVNGIDALGLQISGSATLALEPTLLMSEEAAAAYCARQAAKAAAAAALAAALAESSEIISETKQYGKGERNWAHESDNPWKGWTVDPKDPTKVRLKDQNGKDVVKPRPPGFPDPKKKPQPPKPNPAPKPPESTEGRQQPPKPDQTPQPKESGK